ncbi:MAG: ArnT family glycosyltransferase [Candidatus Brocadiia bacterium]
MNQTYEATAGEKGARSSWPCSRTLLLGIAVGVILLYALGLTDLWRFQRDSAIYMGLARSIVEGEGYRFNHENHTFYTPGLPLMLAATGSITEVPQLLTDSFLGYNLLLTCLGLGSILLFYFLLRELDLPPPVFVAAFLFFAFSRTLYYYSTHIMTDVPFTFFAIGSLLLGFIAVRRKGWKSWLAVGGAGFTVMAASSVRPVGPLLLMAITGGIWLHWDVLDEWKRKLGQTLLLWIPAVTALGAYAYWTRTLKSEGGRHYFRGYLRADRIIEFFLTLLEKSGEHMGGLSDALLGTDAGVIPGVILAVLLAVGLVKLLKSGERQFSIFALLLGGVIIAGGWPLGRRYLLPAIPVMCIWLALGGYTVGQYLHTRREWWTRSRVRKLGYSCVAIVLLVNLIRIGDVVIEQRRGLYEEVQDGKLTDYRPVLEWLRENETNDDVLIIGYEASTIHYFTRLRTKHVRDRDTEDWSREKTLEWAREADYIIKDEEKAESTAAFEKHLPTDNLKLEPVVREGMVTLLRVVREQ